MIEGQRDKEVIVTDIQMPIASMVVFMVKWALAFIPAMIILIGARHVVSLALGW